MPALRPPAAPLRTVTRTVTRSTVSLRARGAASPALAWERYSLLAHWPRWSPQITSVRADGDRLRPGLTGVVHGPLGVAVPFTVTEVDEAAMTWAWTAHLGPVRLRLHHGVEPDPRRAGGSVTWLRVSGPLPIVVGYAPPARWAISRLVRP